MREFTSTATTAEVSRPLEDVSFSLDGVGFHCYGEARSTFHMSELARRALSGDEGALASSLAESFLLYLGPEEYARFTAHVAEHQTPDEVILEITAWLGTEAQKRSEAETGRPTRQRPPSQSGPQDREQRMSRVISLQTGDVQVMDEQGRPVPQDRKAKGGRTRAASTG